MTKNRYLLHQKIISLYHLSCRLNQQQEVKLSDLTRLSQTADEIQEVAELLLAAAFKARSKTL